MFILGTNFFFKSLTEFNARRKKISYFKNPLILLFSFKENICMLKCTTTLYWQLRIRHRFFLVEYYNLLIFECIFLSIGRSSHFFQQCIWWKSLHIFLHLLSVFKKWMIWYIYIFDSIGEFCYTILLVPINFSEWASILVRIIALPTRTRLIISLINPIPDYFLDNLNWPELKDT